MAPSIYDFSVTVRELWSIHEAYRKLAFPAADIDMVTNAVLEGQLGYCGMQVTQGDKTFVVSVPRPMSEQELFNEWGLFVEALKSMSDSELNAVYAGSFIRNNSVGLLIGLQVKGFDTSIPRKALQEPAL